MRFESVKVGLSMMLRDNLRDILKRVLKRAFNAKVIKKEK